MRPAIKVDHVGTAGRIGCALRCFALQRLFRRRSGRYIFGRHRLRFLGCGGRLISLPVGLRLRCFTQRCSNRVPLTPFTRPFKDSSEYRNRYVSGPNQGGAITPIVIPTTNKSRGSIATPRLEESLSYRPDSDRPPAASPEMNMGVFPFGFNSMHHGGAHFCRRGQGKGQENVGTKKQGKKWGPTALARWAKHCPTNVELAISLASRPHSAPGCRLLAPLAIPLPAAINPLERQRQMQ